MIPKFRAWHKELKYMHEVEILEFFPEEMGGLKVCFPLPGNNYYDEFNLSQVELMQWTGLKDKDGKDIYEGDVLSVDWYDAGICYFEVKYDKEYGWWVFEDKANKDIEAWGDLPDYNIKIIGSIYENPELLEAQE